MAPKNYFFSGLDAPHRIQNAQKIYEARLRRRVLPDIPKKYIKVTLEDLAPNSRS
jgi:hypothetical protein